MTHVEHKNVSSPDEVLKFKHGKVELLKISGARRFTLEPDGAGQSM